jgi:hypothetical protein
MSGFTQTTNEVLYAFYGAATTTTIAATAQSLIVGYPEIVIPGSYMSVVGKRSSSLRLKMGGLLTATATIPTFTFGLEITSAVPGAFVTPAAGNTLVTSAAITPVASTNVWWHMEFEIGLRTLVAGALSTVSSAGEIRSQAAFSAAGWQAYEIPATGAYAPFAQWESDLQYFLWPYLTLSAATAGNTMTTEYAKLYGEN